MAGSVRAKAVRRPTIDLSGLFGTFKLAKKSSVEVSYFSTYASTDPLEGGHHQVLDLLQPMRERVTANELRSLDALLQRDLSDERIASELIPYLAGQHSRVGFFPPILAVVLPKGFVHAKSDVKYPSASEDKYGEFWSVERFEDASGGRSRCGILSIDPGTTDIIVLDGQHRANAFRYAAGGFKPKPEYEAFYHDAIKIKDYQSDLPVTIIWFESTAKQPVQPTDVSRELFVAVNNSAKRVSASRTALLDEASYAGLGINTYYRSLAERRGFEIGAASLFTAGMDYDDHLQTGKPPVYVLTTPVILLKALRQLMFGSATYFDLSDRTREAPNTTASMARFGYVVGKTLSDGVHDAEGTIPSDLARKQFREAYSRTLIPLVDDMLSRPQFLKVHYAALERLAKWTAEHSEAPYGHVWQKIVLSGEGLYSAYGSSALQATRRTRKILNALDSKLVELRAEEAGYPEKAGRVTQWFDTYTSVAFQTGYLMLVSYLAHWYYDGDVKLASTGLGDVVGNVTLKTWDIFFNELRQAVVGETTPRSWPAYMRMLAIFCADTKAYADILDPADEPLEVTVVRNRLREYVKAYKKEHETPPPPREIRKKAKGYANDAVRLFAKLSHTVTATPAQIAKHALTAEGHAGES